MASTPADTVLACADTFLLAKSFATEANSFLNRSELAGDIMPVARSIDDVGLCGVNVADASATLLAIPVTSAVSSAARGREVSTVYSRERPPPPARRSRSRRPPTAAPD